MSATAPAGCTPSSPSAPGCTVVAVPTATLAEEASAIVVGHVARIRSVWDRTQGQIFTMITLHVGEVVKGQVADAELTIKQVGGVVGDLESWVFGSPQFERGEKVLLFLGRHADGSARVAHLYQGKFSVLVDLVDGEQFGHRDSRAEGVHVMGGTALPSHYDLYRLRDFTDWLRTDLPAAYLTALNRSWNSPPAIVDLRGGRSTGCDQRQKAYVLTRESERLSFGLSGSEKSPILNPCFVIRGWGGPSPARLKIGGQVQVPGPDFRQGIVRDTDGTQAMVIWVRQRSFQPLKYEIY